MFIGSNFIVYFNFYIVLSLSFYLSKGKEWAGGAGNKSWKGKQAKLWNTGADGAGIIGSGGGHTQGAAVQIALGFIQKAANEN